VVIKLYSLNMRITAETFFTDAVAVTSLGEPWIHLSYREFVAFFRKIPVLTESDLILGAYFTYGWMPTMLRLRGDLAEVTQIANKVRTAEGITKAEFATFVSAMNGSVVGASKLLHFITPECHAIWDSRVYRYLYRQHPYHNRVNSPDRYWNYLAFLDTLTADQRFAMFKHRAAELMMFTKGEV